jgi:hypothetical protein
MVLTSARRPQESFEVSIIAISIVVVQPAPMATCVAKVDAPDHHFLVGPTTSLS